MSNEIQITNLENKMLQGITLRTALWFVGGIVSILTSVILTYSSIMNKLEKSQDAIGEIRKGKEITDIQLRTIEMQLQTMEIRVVRLETELKTSKN